MCGLRKRPLKGSVHRALEIVQTRWGKESTEYIVDDLLFSDFPSDESFVRASTSLA